MYVQYVITLVVIQTILFDYQALRLDHFNIKRTHEQVKHQKIMVMDDGPFQRAHVSSNTEIREW